MHWLCSSALCTSAPQARESMTEATLILVDNSEWTRSGDYAPTRYQAQADAVNLLAGAKTEANPENTVGVLTMAGKSPRVLVAPTPDLGKVGATPDCRLDASGPCPALWPFLTHLQAC